MMARLGRGEPARLVPHDHLEAPRTSMHSATFGARSTGLDAFCIFHVR